MLVRQLNHGSATFKANIGKPTYKMLGTSQLDWKFCIVLKFNNENVITHASIITLFARHPDLEIDKLCLCTN